MARPRPLQTWLLFAALVLAAAFLLARRRETSSTSGASSHFIVGPSGSVVGHLEDEGEPSRHADLYDKALAQVAREDFDGAARTYGRLRDLEPEKADPYWGLGSALLKQGRHVEARVEYERALAIDPRSKPALQGAGLCRVRSGEPALAATYFDRALALDPAYFPSLYGAAKARALTGRCAEAQGLTRRFREAEVREGDSGPSLVPELDALVTACREDGGLAAAGGSGDAATR